MRILVFSHEFPPMVGGAGEYVKNLLDGLCLLKHEVHFLTSTGADGAAIPSAVQVSEYHTYDWSRTWFLYWGFIFQRFYNRNAPFDCVIFANYTANIIASKVYRDIKCKYITILHGNDVDYFRHQSRVKDKLMFNKDNMQDYLKQSHKIVAVSKDFKNHILELFPILSNVNVVHHGIKIGDYGASMDNEDVGINFTHIKQHDGYIIFAASRIVELKGMQNVLAVFEILMQMKLNAYLIIGGDGNYFNTIKNIVNKSKHASRIYLTGNLSREKMNYIFKNADLFMMLSMFHETFGMVFIEAMSFGLPVIGSDLGGIPEVIDHGESGFVYNPLDHDSIAMEVKALCENRAKSQRLGANGLVRVKDYFNNVRMADETIKIHENTN